MNKDFIKKCTLLGLSEKQAKDIMGKVSKSYVPTKKKPAKIEAPKMDATVDVDAMSKTAFEFGVRDAITYLLES